MKVKQMINANGNPAANQFIINDGNKEVFQSYETKICEVENGKITIDINSMGYSKTTSKHLYIFLGMTRKEIEKEIKQGKIYVADLNN